MSLKIYYFIIILLIISIYSKVIKKSNNEILNNYHSNECKTIEECHSCTFNELKTIDECQVNGYKTKIKCINKNNEIKIYYESCNENTRFNPVYIFLIICIVIFICSYRYQKTQKDSTLQNLMVKLSILKN